MRVTKIGPPAPTFRKALGYDPGTPIGPVEPPEFEGARVFVPVGTENVWTPAPEVTDSDDATYAETSEHDEAMRVALDFPVRFSGAILKIAVETAGDRTYTFEGATLPDFADAVELAETTFAGVADWEIVEFEFDYPSPEVGHQYYRIIGPDEVRRWHNLRLIEDTREGCECLELCRDPEPAALVASNDEDDGAQGDPIELGVAPGAGALWMILSDAPAVFLPGFNEIAGPLTSGSGIPASMYTREATSGDSGSVIVGSPSRWLTAAWSGVNPQYDAIESLDDQTTGGGATCEVPITVPAGDHLVVVYVNHDNTLEPTAEAGWTLVETQAYAVTKYHALAYAFVSGGSLTPGIVVSAAGNWFGFAASFALADQGEAIEGGPNATAGDGTKAAPCTHDHHYTAEQIEVTPFGSIAADNVQDALEEIVAEASGGTPATTVESETTFGITPAVGTDTEYARQDHTHGSPANPVTGAALIALGLVGPLLIADDHSTPLVFEDILQTEEGDDFLYADIGA